jgi:hypothetical protein
MLPPFKAMLLLERAGGRKSGGPTLLAPSFKVERDVHSQRSGFAVAPGVKGLNARGPLKVHRKWRLEESALAPGALAPIGRHMTAREFVGSLWAHRGLPVTATVVGKEEDQNSVPRRSKSSSKPYIHKRVWLRRRYRDA